MLAAALHVSPSWCQDDAPESPQREELPAPTVYKGDVLYLKTGKVISNVQILRNTPVFYEVQFQPGLEPLMIPRKQVQRVVFDEIDPARARIRASLEPRAEEVSLATGERVSRYLMEKLSAPLSNKALTYDQVDLIDILGETAERMQVNLKVHPSIKNRPEKVRLWTLETTPETTLMALLREELVGQFKFAEVLFENDTIFVMTKQAAKNRKAIQAENNR